MLKTKIFAAFSCIALVIVGITCGILYHKYTDDIQNQSLFLSSIISRQFSAMVDLYLQNIEELSLAVAISPVVQSNLLDYARADESLKKEIIGYKLNPYLFDFSYPKPYVHSISIHTLDGYMYSYSKEMETRYVPTYTFKDLQQFHRQLETSKFLLHLPDEEQLAAAGGPPKRLVSFIRRIHRIPTKQAIGYVNININVNAFEALALAEMRANELDAGMSILLLDGEGAVIYDNAAVDAPGARRTFDAAALADGKTAGELVWDGKAYIYTYEWSAYTGWRAVVLFPKDAVLRKQEQIRSVIIAAGLATTLVAALISYTLSHHITTPLRALMRHMSSVELGDFRRRMEYAGNNEFGKLSRVYNHMLDSIARLIHEVYESKLAEKNAQLAALHAQINPHFLYNTLNMMKSISRLRGAEEVAEISESLAGLFQYSMKNMHRPVTLQDELDHIGNYFKIQQHRFGNRVNLTFDVEEPLRRALILKLTIQPVVENAMNHGLARLKSGGTVAVRAARRGETLVLRIEDDGAGMAPERLRALQEALLEESGLQGLRDEPGGVGLANIHHRIQLYYGKEHGAAIDSAPGEGTRVELTMPLRFADVPPAELPPAKPLPADQTPAEPLPAKPQSEGGCAKP